MPIILPCSPNAKGCAYEYLTLQYLIGNQGYELVSPPVFSRTPSGKWRQIDGIVRREKTNYSVESRCRSESLSESGIWEIAVLSKELGFSNSIISSFSGFHLPEGYDIGNTVLLDYKEILSELSPDHIFSSLLDRMTYRDGYISFRDRGRVKVELDENYREKDTLFLKDWQALWINRLPAFEETTTIEERPEIQGVELTPPYSGKIGFLWSIEDSLRGFANINLKTTVEIIYLLTQIKSDDIEYSDIYNTLKIIKPDLRKNSLYNVMRNLKCLGLVDKTEDGYLHMDRENISELITDKKFNLPCFERMLKDWQPYNFVRDLITTHRFKSTIKLKEHIDGIFNQYYPYARNLFNMNKLRGILNLMDFVKTS